jgi:hypothetical protein
MTTGKKVWEASREKYRAKLQALIDGRPVTGVKPMTPAEAKATLAEFDKRAGKGRI